MITKMSIEGWDGINYSDDVRPMAIEGIGGAFPAQKPNNDG